MFFLSKWDPNHHQPNISLLPCCNDKKKGYVHILYSPPLCTNTKSMLQQTTTQYLNQWYFDNNQTQDVTHLWFLWTHTVTQRCKPTSMPVDILSQSRYCTSLAHEENPGLCLKGYDKKIQLKNFVKSYLFVFCVLL